MKLKTFLAAAGLAAFASSATATTVRPANLAEIVQIAESGFVGVVSAVETVETPSGWADKVSVKVSEAVFGPVSDGATVTWLQIRMGEKLPIAGMPKFAAGEEHLVFLSGKAAGSQFQSPMALGQGDFRVSRDSSTGEAFARNAFMNATVFQGLDTDAVAKAAVAVESTAGKAAAANLAVRTKELASKLAVRRSGASDLSAVVSAAKAMKADKDSVKKFAK